MGREELGDLVQGRVLAPFVGDAGEAVALNHGLGVLAIAKRLAQAEQSDVGLGEERHRMAVAEPLEMALRAADRAIGSGSDHPARRGVGGNQAVNGNVVAGGHRATMTAHG